MKQTVCVTRKTSESVMKVKLDASGLASDYRQKIKTHAPFFSHMLEHIAWRSGVTIETEFTLDEFYLNHVIYEDLGITMGKAARSYVWENKPEGAVVRALGTALGRAFYLDGGRRNQSAGVAGAVEFIID